MNRPDIEGMMQRADRGDSHHDAGVLSRYAQHLERALALAEARCEMACEQPCGDCAGCDRAHEFGGSPDALVEAQVTAPAPGPGRPAASRIILRTGLQLCVDAPSDTPDEELLAIVARRWGAYAVAVDLLTAAERSCLNDVAMRIRGFLADPDAFVAAADRASDDDDDRFLPDLGVPSVVEDAKTSTDPIRVSPNPVIPADDDEDEP